MNVWSFLAVFFTALFIGCGAVPAICTAIVECKKKKELCYIYKILDKTTGAMIEVPKDVYDKTYAIAERVIARRHKMQKLYNKQKETINEQ